MLSGQQISRLMDCVGVGLSTAANSVQEVDTANCDGVLFIGVPASTAARTWSLALKSGATTTGFVNCASTHTVTSTAVRNDVIFKDVFRPAKRYLGATLSSTTATPCYLIAIKYSLRKPVSTFSSTANVPVAIGGISRSISPSSAT